MNTVTVSRRIDAPADAVRERIRDVEAFMRAGGFDEVVVEGDRIDLTNGVGIATIRLTLEQFEAEGAVLAYRQRDGIFAEMTTRYDVATANGEGDGDGNGDGGGSEACTVTATTEFAVDVALVGDLMDATIIERQRRRELDAQFDWLEAELED